MLGLFGKDSNDSKLKEIRNKKKKLRKMIKVKEYDQALKMALNLLEDVPYENDVLFIVGSIYYMRNNYTKSIIYLERSLEIGEYDTEALLLNALAHFKLSQLKKAEMACNKILEIDSKNKHAIDLLSKIDKSKNQ